MSTTPNNELYHTHISSKHKLFDLKLKEVWKYRDLIIMFTKRSFVLTYKQTVLGPAWIFINPFLTSLIYTFVFGGIAGMDTDGVPQLLFYLCSNAIWAFFSSCVTSNASTFTGNAGVFGKVYFPRLTTPISNVLSAMVRFGVQMILVLAFLIYYVITGVVSPNWLAWLLIPIVLIHLGIMGLGFGIIISSMTTKYRDLSILVGFGVQLWMYATPIVYPLSQLGDGIIKKIFMLNPVTVPVEIFRYAVLGRGEIDFVCLAISWVFTILVAVIGIMMFNRVERNFMDTV
ncbi:MAG: ABC transporter permease [Acutalibacteraceae bacterium]|nr:ABC transporter permease [Acutalibacteraceae bacterium]